MGRPTKRPEDRSIRGDFTYRPDQAEKVKRLTAEKRLSTILQAAIDAA